MPRLDNRYEEIGLPGVGNLTVGSNLLHTSEDLRGKVFAGAVLRLGPVMPLLVAADVRGHTITLADPFNGIVTDIGRPGSAALPPGASEAKVGNVVNARLFALNLQLTPGVYDFTNGQTLVSPSTGKSPKPAIGAPGVTATGTGSNAEAVIDPMSVVPMTVLAAAASPGGRDVSPVSVIGWLQSGDHIVGAGAIGAVVDSMRQPLPPGTPVTNTQGTGSTTGTSKVELQVFSLQAAYPHSSQPRQRVYRFINGADGFPGISYSYISWWRARMGHATGGSSAGDHEARPRLSKDLDEDGNDDAARLIKSIASEAEQMYAGPQTAGANLAVLSSLLAYELPGTVTVDHGATLVTTSADLVPFLRPGDVIRIGNNGPLVVAEVPAIPVAGEAAAGSSVGTATTTSSSSAGVVAPASFSVRLDASFTGESLKAARIFLLPDASPLPGTVTLETTTGGALATTDNWRMRVLPNEVLLVVSNPMMFVTVGPPPSSGSNAATGVSLAEQHDVPPGYPVTATGVTIFPAFTVPKDAAVTAGLRVFRTGVYAAIGPSSKLSTGSGASVGTDGQPAFRQRGLGGRSASNGRRAGHPATAAAGSAFVELGAALTVTGNGGPLAACVADVENGSTEVLISGCDPRSILRPRDEVFIGKPQAWDCNSGPAGLASAAGAAGAGSGAAAAPGASAAGGSKGTADVVVARSCLCPFPYVIAAQTATGTGTGNDPVTATSIQLAAPYTGPTATGLPLYRTGAAQLPGTVTLNPGQTIVPVADGNDPRPYLQSGDVIELRSLALALAGKPTGALGSVTSDGSASSGSLMWFPRMIVGGGSIPILGGQGAQESAAQTSPAAATDPQRSMTIAGPAGVSAGPLLGVSTRDFYLTEPFSGTAPIPGLTVRRLPLRMLPGRLSVSLGAVQAFTSRDLREYLTPNRRIYLPALKAYLTVAQPLANGDGGVAPSSGSLSMPGGSSAAGSSGPGASITQSRLTLRDVVTGAILDPLTAGTATGTGTGTGSAPSSSSSSVVQGLPLTAVSQCPTLPALSPYAITASGGGGGPLAGSKASGPIASVIAKVRALEAFCLQGHAPSDARVWLPAFVDSSVDTISGDMPNLLDELASRQMPGTVSVISGSAILSSTVDLSTYITTGDVVRLGSAPQTYVVAAQPAGTAFRITAPYAGATASGLPLYQQYRRVRLSATVDVQYGNPTAITHGDLRRELASGDLVQVVSRITGRVLLREYVVLPPFTATALTLSEAYAGATEAGCTIFRLIAGSGPGVLLPGTVSASRGSTVVATTEDLSGTLRAGDRVRITTVEVLVAEPVTTRSFGIQDPYPGTTGTGFRAFNMGRTRAQLTLEHLARLKLQCRSIYCLAKIEEMERSIPSDISRSLNAGALLGGVEPPKGADSATGIRDDVLAQQAAAEAAVEKEWQQWYSRAKAQLGIGSGGGVPLMTQAQAEALATSGGSGGAAAKPPPE